MAYDKLMVSCQRCGGDIGVQEFEMPPSPVPHLLQNLGNPGTRLHQTEVKDIQITISQMELDMTLLETEIDHIQAIQTQLQRRYDTMGRFLQSHRNLVAPIRKLPIEVLSQIFTLCVSLPKAHRHARLGPDELQLWESHNMTYITREVTVLGQICQLWRKVAFSTPYLWSFIMIDFNNQGNLLYPRMMVDWLERSGGHPLTILLRGRWDVTERFQDPFRALRHSIIASVPRWRYADIRCEYGNTWNINIDSQEREFLDSFPTFLPCLETLNLGRREGTFRILAAPVLKSLQLWSINNPITANDTLPWTQLTELKLLTMQHHPIIAFLSLCPNLQKFTASLGPYDQGIQQPTAFLNHANLHTMNVTFNGVTTMSLERLCLPTLSQVIYNTHWQDQHAFGQMISLIERSSCDIKDFSYQCDGHESSEMVTRLLEVTPSLEHLEIRGISCHDMNRQVLSRLIFPTKVEDPRPLLPQLRILHLGIPPFEDHYDMLARVVQSRWRLDDGRIDMPDSSLARISSVRVPVDPGSLPIDEATQEIFRVLRGEGLDLQLPDFFFDEDDY